MFAFVFFCFLFRFLRWSRAVALTVVGVVGVVVVVVVVGAVVVLVQRVTGSPQRRSPFEGLNLVGPHALLLVFIFNFL